MWRALLSLIIGVLLIIHGIAHWTLPTGWGTSPTENSWLLGSFHLGSSTIHMIGVVLSIVTLLIFLAGGVALFAHLSWWRTLAVTASTLSLLLILLFWKTNMLLGVVIDVGVIAALLIAHWPSTELLWA